MGTKILRVLLGLAVGLLMVSPPVWSGGGKESASVTISMIHANLREEQTAVSQAWNEGFDKFKKDYPNVKFDEEVLRTTDLETKLQALAATDALPDYFQLKGSMTYDFAKNGAMKPIDIVLDKDAAWKNIYIDGMFDEFTYDGHVYGAPKMLAAVSMIYYNKAILKEVGYEQPPKYWDEFVTMCKAIKAKKGIIPVVAANAPKVVLGTMWFNDICEKIIGPAWFPSIAAVKGAKFTDPGFIRALQVLRDFYVDGLMNEDTNSLGYEAMFQYFIKGDAAMFIDGSWNVSNAQKTFPSELVAQTGLAFLPGFKDGKGIYTSIPGASGWANAFGRKGADDQKKRDVLVALLKYTTGPDVFKRVFELGDIPPTKMDLDPSKMGPLTKQLFAMLKQATIRPIYDTRLRPALIEVLHSGIQEVVIGTLKPEDLAARVQKEYESLYKAQ